MTTCPCCGSQAEGDLRRAGCDACGARPVGPPLARPERELPSYGRALFVGAAGALSALAFSVATVAALFEKGELPTGFWDFVAAAETAAWRLKFTLLPASIVAAWAGWRLRRGMLREPSRFVGARAMRRGLALVSAVACVIMLLIGVTVPERLRQRALAAQAAVNAQRHAVHRVLLAYSSRYNTLPPDPKYLDGLPDPDGTVRQVRELLQAGEYMPEANLAALPPKNRGGRRRAGALRISQASTRAGLDDAPGAKLSLTNYTLVLPGPDKLLGTPDDIRIRDGLSAPPAVQNTQPTPRG